MSANHQNNFIWLMLLLCFSIMAPYSFKDSQAQSPSYAPSSMTQYQREQYKSKIKSHARNIATGTASTSPQPPARAPLPAIKAVAPGTDAPKTLPPSLSNKLESIAAQKATSRASAKPPPSFVPTYQTMSRGHGYAPVANAPISHTPYRESTYYQSATSGASYQPTPPPSQARLPAAVTTPPSLPVVPTEVAQPSQPPPSFAQTHEANKPVIELTMGKGEPPADAFADTHAEIPLITHGETTGSMSEQTRDILAALPDDITGLKAPLQTRDVGIDRMDPTVKLPETAPSSNTQSSDAIGLDMSVKNRKADIHYELEKAYDALIHGETEQAVSIYKAVLSIQPKNTLALFGLATTYHRIGLIDEARPLYGKLLKLNPYNKEALNNFMALVGEEAPHEALAQLERLEKTNPEFSPIPAQMALIYKRLEDYPNAIAHMQRAASKSPENLAYKYNLAILMDQGGRYRQAITLYRQLLDMHRKGEAIPASANSIQERLTFLASNKAS